MPKTKLEIAETSWKNAPAAHIHQAIENLGDYDPEVRNIIIEEAKKRFGQEFILQSVNTTPPNKKDECSIGIRRKGYFLGMLTLAIFHRVIKVFIFETFFQNSETTETLLTVLTITAWLGVLLLSFYIVANRLQNIGCSRWWSLLIVIPIINIFVIIPCLIFPEGYKSTRKIDAAGKITIGLLIAYALYIILKVI